MRVAKRETSTSTELAVDCSQRTIASPVLASTLAGDAKNDHHREGMSVSIGATQQCRSVFDRGERQTED